jgi:hypothetical protein
MRCAIHSFARVGLEQAGSETLDGVLVLTDETVDAGRIAYLGVNVGSMGDMNKLESELQTALRLERLRRAGVDPFVAIPALRPVDVVTQKVTAGKLTGESGSSSFILAYIMGLVLYVVMLMYGIQVMSSVVEEKTSRIAEVLMSSVTPFQMMLGKVFGVGAAALLQLVIWGTTATLVTTYRSALAKLFGASPEAIASMATMKLPSLRPRPAGGVPHLLRARVPALRGDVRGGGCHVQLAAGGAAGGGASVDDDGRGLCDDVLDAQRSERFARDDLEPHPAAGPIRRAGTVFPGARAPAGTAAVDRADIWRHAAGSVGGGRIYRVGILLHGKRPKLAEVLRWVRA